MSAPPPTAFAQMESFYTARYRLFFGALLTGTEPETLGSPKNQKCRFCGKSSPEVSFNQRTHAIPEAIGNKSLLTSWECDTCNHDFGIRIENDFGAWSKPLRALSGIKGKAKKAKKLKGPGTFLTINKHVLEVVDTEEHPAVRHHEDGKSLTFQVKREPYTPIRVLKAFVRMGLSIMPEQEIGNFTKAIEWVTRPHDDDRQFESGGMPIFRTHVSGPMPSDVIQLTLLRRRDEQSPPLPYMFLVMVYGNEQFQVVIPSDDKDRNGTANLVHYPHPLDLHPLPDCRVYKRDLLDLTSNDRRYGELELFGCHVEQVSETKLGTDETIEETD